MIEASTQSFMIIEITAPKTRMRTSGLSNWCSSSLSAVTRG